MKQPISLSNRVPSRVKSLLAASPPFFPLVGLLFVSNLTINIPPAENNVETSIFDMASRFALLLLSSLLIATATYQCTATEVDVAGDAAGSDDPLIRQVVDHGEIGANSLLNADHHFTIFKTKFGKAYATQEEHDYRLSVFKTNLRRAMRHQKLDPSAVHGVTQFSDLTPREFRSKFLGVNRRLRLPSDAHKAPILPTNDLPTDFDWRDHGAVTPVKNQVNTESDFALRFLIRYILNFWKFLQI